MRRYLGGFYGRRSAEPVMRFFTHDLYVRFNSPDDGVADDAHADWEAAVRDYHAHLAKIRDRLPSPVRFARL